MRVASIPEPVQSISCGDYHVLAQTAQRVYHIGDSLHESNFNNDMQVFDMQVKQVLALSFASMVVTLDARVLVMGDNQHDMLGCDQEFVEAWTEVSCLQYPVDAIFGRFANCILLEREVLVYPFSKCYHDVVFQF